MSIRVVTDSTSDLPAEVVARYQIPVVPLYINVGKQGYLDGIDITREEFYRKLPAFPVHPTTAVPSPQKFRAIYDALADEGATDIISIHISESLSASVNVARVAAQETTSAKVTVIDGHQLSMGTGFLVETAAKMAAAGQALGEILGAIQSQIKRSHVFAALDTLEFLRRSGRMNRFVANMGALLQIKPILTMYDGKPGTEKVRTRERAMNRLVEMLEAVGPLERVAIVHTHAALERVQELRRKAEHLLPKGDIPMEDITPVIGAHIGPSAIGFAVVGAKE
ncbi:MAG TPA: DegV family protein [Anaerolineales bacterium]|nr:DegV family protein [Anaerolineales bacterium]